MCHKYTCSQYLTNHFYYIFKKNCYIYVYLTNTLNFKSVPWDQWSTIIIKRKIKKKWLILKSCNCQNLIFKYYMFSLTNICAALQVSFLKKQWKWKSIQSMRYFLGGKEFQTHKHYTNFCMPMINMFKISMRHSLRDLEWLDYFNNIH